MGKKHFMIKYESSKQTYLIKDLGEGNGTFVKIVPQMQLASGFTISFGEIHFNVLIKAAEKESPSYMCEFDRIEN